MGHKMLHAHDLNTVLYPRWRAEPNFKALQKRPRVKIKMLSHNTPTLII
jgi:hypothetical protein